MKPLICLSAILVVISSASVALAQSSYSSVQSSVDGNLTDCPYANHADQLEDNPGTLTLNNINSNTVQKALKGDSTEIK